MIARRRFPRRRPDQGRARSLCAEHVCRLIVAQIDAEFHAGLDRLRLQRRSDGGAPFYWHLPPADAAQRGRAPPTSRDAPPSKPIIGKKRMRSTNAQPPIRMPITASSRPNGSIGRSCYARPPPPHARRRATRRRASPNCSIRLNLWLSRDRSPSTLSRAYREDGNLRRSPRWRSACRCDHRRRDRQTSDDARLCARRGGLSDLRRPILRAACRLGRFAACLFGRAPGERIHHRRGPWAPRQGRDAITAPRDGPLYGGARRRRSPSIRPASSPIRVSPATRRGVSGQLLADEGGSAVLALAAYNAGGGRVAQWIEAYGDPRRLPTSTSSIKSSASFDETRDYVQRVMENWRVYRMRFGAPALPPPAPHWARADR